MGYREVNRERAGVTGRCYKTADTALQVFDIPIGYYAFESKPVVFDVICQPTGYPAEAMNGETNRKRNDRNGEGDNVGGGSTACALQCRRRSAVSIPPDPDLYSFGSLSSRPYRQSRCLLVSH